ncbi:SusC/RagA family TonB-linked outer membrane protein [Echinicola strongylocentroti]|uniref:SusC/RagA family TonB-linked outer membrane protein n=1 Tax=Echinicola strongylocentroti TaxID=1795355 RepID=A0A2Z4INJ1_9BACT|nr:SusC/RagA family TonB-linked outer membrane protein [Echinicola strongylocentroti]AWW32238.1 SusC/RagA family TonB-linked outer membrane protein [Echinicola strongylocentroti]
MKTSYIKLTGLIIISLALTNLTYAQHHVRGQVTDSEERLPVPGVSVLIKNQAKGTITDLDGNYDIEVSEQDTLVFSFVGYETTSIPVQHKNMINAILSPSSLGLEEVVVTALGIEKDRSKVGYAVQEVKGESLQKAVTPNVVESLSGKVAGLIVTSNGGDFFSDPQLYLRGSKPLVVVDGVPQPNNDLWNISADDIENITVLKAASASALYGSLGENGAVQITLKSGKNLPKGTSISFNSSTTFQTGFLRIPHAQTAYGPGNTGRYEFGTGAAGGGGTNDYDYSIWGPKFDGQLIKQFDSPIDPETGERVPTPWISRGEDNLKNFMETGIMSSNNLSIQTNTDQGSFVISNTYKYSKASTPGQKLDINTTRLRGNIILSDRLNLDGSLQYNYQYSNNRIRGSYGPSSPIYLMSIWGGAHYDIRDMKDYWVPGKEGIKQYFVENWRYNNPYALSHAWKKPWTKHDILTYLKLNYKISDKVNAYIRSTLNTYSLTDNEEISMDIYDYSIPDRGGRFRYNATRYFENNTDFLITYKDYFANKIGLDATFGANQRYFREEGESASTTQLIVPEVFKLSNSVDRVTPTSYKEYKGVYSAYASLDLSYEEMFYLGFTGRVDKSSTLPKSNDTFFYPSVTFSTVLNEVFTLPQQINYLKLRSAYARVGGDMDIYTAANSYNTGNRWRNEPTASYPGTIENPNLSPAFTNSLEYGFEAKLFNNRVGIDFSVFQNEYGPQIFTQSFSTASGWDGIRENGRTTERKGMDFSINVTPIQKQDFNWSAIINYGKYTDYLTSLPPLPDGTPQLNEGRTEVGDRLYDYWYTSWEKTPEGELIILPSGLPKQTDFAVNQGSTQPNYTLSLQNTFRYKDISLSFLIDGRFGGVTYDRYERDLWRSGSHPEAIHPEREQSNIAYVNGEDAKTMLIPGVKVVGGEVTYDPEGNIISDTREYAPNDYMVDYQSWAINYKAAWQSVLIDKTFVKLREVVVSYNIPSSVVENTFFNHASVSFVGRNLLYWTKDNTYGDLDSYTVSTGDTNLQMPSQRTYGFNLNLQF